MDRLRKFRQQRSNAKRRGIGWELTFRQWCTIWDDSGLYHLRGPRGFVMHRNSDEAPTQSGTSKSFPQSIISEKRWKFITWGTATIPSQPLWTLL
jgi:hypothetical protein